MTVVFGCIGLLFGSFLNAWIWRTRVNKSIVQGRSECPSCGIGLSWKENIPILSYLYLKGRCLACQEPISAQYPLVEFAVAILFAGTAWVHSGDVLYIIRDCFVLYFLVFTFVYDFRYQEIWDRMTIYPAMVLLTATAIFGWQSWQSVMLGMMVGGGVFALQFFISKGAWVGGGDIRLGLFMGVILGWPYILVALFLAYVGGSFIILPFLLTGKKSMASRIPFGTYLTVATVFTMFFGSKVLGWYLGLF